VFRDFENDGAILRGNPHGIWLCAASQGAGMALRYRTILSGVLATFCGAISSAESPVTANTADAIRGGWVADVEGIRHIFVLKVRDAAVSGIYCAVDCRDPVNLAFVDRGSLSPEGVRFQILRVGRVQSRTDVVGQIDGDRLLLTFKSSGKRAGPSQLSLQRDLRKPAARTVEELFKRRGIESGPLLIAGSPTPYLPPGPNEILKASALEGLWVWSTGPNKQHFIFRQAGDRILGVACGPCDNPYTFGPLDNVAIRGDTLTFDINHEDWGIGIEFGPYANRATATVSHHEMHLRTLQQNGPRTIQGDLVLAGPLRTAP
jgi:hypothetical protein